MAFSFTTQELLDELKSSRIQMYKAMIEKFGAPNEAVNQALVNGFTDGINTGVNQVIAMLEIEVRTEVKEETNND